MVGVGVPLFGGHTRPPQRLGPVAGEPEMAAVHQHIRCDQELRSGPGIEDGAVVAGRANEVVRKQVVETVGHVPADGLNQLLARGDVPADAAGTTMEKKKKSAKPGATTPQVIDAALYESVLAVMVGVPVVTVMLRAVTPPGSSIPCVASR